MSQQQLFEYIEKNGAKEIYKQDASLCEKYKDIINQKINDFLICNPQKKANIFEIYVELSEEDVKKTFNTDDNDYNLQRQIPDAIHKAFNNWVFKSFMKKGDILKNTYFSESYYNDYYKEINDGTFLFDGEKLVGLYTKHEYLGYVTKDFLAFSEFSPTYWDELYDGFSLVFVDLSKCKRINERHYEVTFNNQVYKLTSLPYQEVPEEGIVAVCHVYDDDYENEEFEYRIIEKTEVIETGILDDTSYRVYRNGVLVKEIPNDNL